MHLIESLCSILHFHVINQCVQVAILDAEFCANQGLTQCVVKKGCKRKVAIIQLWYFKM